MKHHVSDEMLADHARGTLSVGWSLGIATHLALCPACRKRVATLEAVGGALLDDIEPALLQDASFDAILSRINELRDDSIAVEPTRSRIKKDSVAPVLPEPLRTVVGGDTDALKWKRISGDVSQVLLDTGDKTTSCRLLRVKAGRPVAEHSHGGKELTLVLAGSFSDTLGTFARGDIELTDESVEHQPIADDGEDCICFAVTDAPLRFRNPIARILQPLFRI